MGVFFRAACPARGSSCPEGRRIDPHTRRQAKESAAGAGANELCTHLAAAHTPRWREGGMWWGEPRHQDARIDPADGAASHSLVLALFIKV